MALVTHSCFDVPFSGNGEDCHRTWEAVLMGSVPVVWNSTGLWSLFKKNGMVVLKKKTADKISLQSLRKKRLKKKRQGTQSRAMLLAQYWFDLIDAVKAEYNDQL